ncbi:MAG: tRNA-(ms[2]io[6]A)-hydroxylase [Acidobacteria bacterium]|nr:tRNA-(ms[2]io[6]A)-hydroxylase [Acidobacteriota bacterium]NIM60978.1 tRNA-(ms[2]io[6]A)-hydroxylase [Acidobacteriota bacterium]NIO59946.1 tRNA-(ms[2]io[6]A)-hydroxylase [Acidobacteriota bacterium]NIQ31018.1 tRNA-(ms[2]io[6]A)-hydroxylase [Acidobacteriota bacterium]NIQ86146.1 tRNA-(ms[2]io[6]A)-hydroxylase [Acidobacteriota bacterium]
MAEAESRRERHRERFLAAVEELPLLTPTPAGWAELAADRLPEFLADHAVCEQQAALFGLNLVAHYPGDPELVDAMTALAAEEVTHLRRVSQLLHRRGLQPSKRRSNPYVQGLHEAMERENETALKCDRLLVGALIEARSCERFTRLLAVLAERDTEVADLLFDLGPAEKRHWQTFHRLAGRDVDDGWFQLRWEQWLRRERELMTGRGTCPTVHG